MALDADRKNGPAARSFAADAHDCIMVRIKRPYRIQVCGTKMHPNGELPSDPQQIDRHRQTLKLCRKKAPVAVHHRSACSGVKALRNTSDARRQAAKLCYRFGPLTPSARSANLIAGDGTKNGFPAPNKEPAKTKNDHLTGKAPYKFESISLQQTVSLSPSAAFQGGEPRFSARVWAAGLATGSAETRQAFHCAPTGGNVSAGPYSSTAVPMMRSVQCHGGPNEVRTRA
jgi:hypothetical protein